MVIERKLDSSEVLISENCRFKVREVGLMGPSIESEDLFGLIESAREKDYFPVGMSVVNIIHGAPDQNEPRAVLYLNREVREQGKEDAIIVQNFIHNRFSFYEFGDGFRYIP